MPNSELCKCPGCGNIPILQQMDTHWWMVYCSKYACDFPLRINGGYRKDAIDNWNQMCKVVYDTKKFEEV